jgi:hypothetical protein
VYVLLKRRRDGCPVWGATLGLMMPTVMGFLLWGWACWMWSPTAFEAVLRRWWISASVGSVGDPRMFTSLNQWTLEIVSDLLGAAMSLGLVVLAGWSLFRRRMLLLIHLLFWGYLALALGLSFVTRLKELRHIIGILPVSALLIGTSLDWNAVLEYCRRSRLRMSAGVLAAVVFLFSASPMRLPLYEPLRLKMWLDPLYASRVLENDRFYNVLRLAGLYLQQHTLPGEVINVSHQGPVTGYYADRHYNILYTMPEQIVMEVLGSTRYLVWDDALFLAMSADQARTVQDYVMSHFVIESVIRDGDRQVIIYRQGL